MKSRSWYSSAMRWFLLLVSILFLPNTHACRWDRDTLAQEYKQAPGIVEIITGRFERFPPRYYEMRLERVSGEIANQPDNLDLYDDAGAACDRLHRSVEAIEWMKKKSTEIERQKLPQNHEHRYRFEANLGTFLFHQWLRDGTPKDKINSAKTARDHIAKAIQINPDAHFGREKYQLMAMDWVIEQVRNPDTKGDSPSFLPIEGTHPHNTKWEFGEKEIDEKEAQNGISGLITLGGAWESIDMQIALRQTLHAQEHNYLAYLSYLRIRELMENGKKSFNPDRLANGIEYAGSALDRKAPLKKFYKKARAESENWQKARWNFMEKTFRENKHPDTHPDFWKNFRYSKKPQKPPFELTSGQKTKLYVSIFLVILFGVPILISFLLVHRRRKMKRLSNLSDTAG